MKKKTFSKTAVKWILIISLIDLQLPYILAFMNRAQIAETLSITVITALIATMLGYFIKSFKETKEEEAVRLEEERRKIEENKIFVDDLRRENPNE